MSEQQSPLQVQLHPESEMLRQDWVSPLTSSALLCSGPIPAGSRGSWLQVHTIQPAFERFLRGPTWITCPFLNQSWRPGRYGALMGQTQGMCSTPPNSCPPQTESGGSQFPGEIGTVKEECRVGENNGSLQERLNKPCCRHIPG